MRQTVSIAATCTVLALLPVAGVQAAPSLDGVSPVLEVYAVAPDRSVRAPSGDEPGFEGLGPRARFEAGRGTVRLAGRPDGAAGASAGWAAELDRVLADLDPARPPVPAPESERSGLHLLGLGWDAIVAVVRVWQSAARRD